MMCYRRACFSFPCLKNYQQWCSCQEFPLHSYLEISRKSLFRIYFYLKKFLLLCFLYFWIDFYYDHYSFHNIWNNLAEFCFFPLFFIINETTFYVWNQTYFQAAMSPYAITEDDKHSEKHKKEYTDRNSEVYFKVNNFQIVHELWIV